MLTDIHHEQRISSNTHLTGNRSSAVMESGVALPSLLALATYRTISKCYIISDCFRSSVLCSHVLIQKFTHLSNGKNLDQTSNPHRLVHRNMTTAHEQWCTHVVLIHFLYIYISELRHTGYTQQTSCSTQRRDARGRVTMRHLDHRRRTNHRLRRHTSTVDCDESPCKTCTSCSSAGQECEYYTGSTSTPA